MDVERIRALLVGVGGPVTIIGAVIDVDALRDGAAIVLATGFALIAIRRTRGRLRARALPPTTTRVLVATNAADASTVPGEMLGAVEASGAAAAAGDAVLAQLDGRRLVPRAATVWAVAIRGEESAIAARGPGGVARSGRSVSYSGTERPVIDDASDMRGDPTSADPAADADAVVEIGSISKVFTGILLADLARDGIVGLEDRLDRHLDGLPPRVGEITLLDLTTHSSGLPRLPGALLLHALTGPLDPYATWDERRMMRALRRVRVRRRRSFRYSNLGVALLGTVLGRAAGSDYGSLLQSRICAPLRLTATGTASAGPPVQGHDRAGIAVPAWRMAAFDGAGGIRSTARDMERFLRAQLDPPEIPLAAALAEARRPRRAAGRIGGDQIGLGWMVRPAGNGRGKVVWHNGGTGGFGAFAAVERDAGTAVALLQSATVSPLTDVAGAELLERLAGRPVGRRRRGDAG